MEETGTQVCKKHEKAWAVFCADRKCLKMLCPQCPIQEHRKHKGLLGSCDSLKESVEHISVEAAETVENLEEFVKKVEEVKKIAPASSRDLHLAPFYLGSTAPDKSKIGTLPDHKQAILINFLPGTLSFTENKSTNQI